MKRTIVIISNDILFPQLFETLLFRKIKELNIILCKTILEIDEHVDPSTCDITILDAILNGVPSFEVMRYLRVDKRIITPIYFFPEIQAERYLHRAYVMGASRIIQKPFDPHILTDEITDYFNSKTI